MTEDAHDKRLKQLEERIGRVKASQAPPKRVDEHFSQANMAWRMVIELVSGLGIGLGVGLGLDALFGTRPIFLVLFVLLGFAAGVRVMMRTAQEINAGDVARTKAGAEDAVAKPPSPGVENERDEP